MKIIGLTGGIASGKSTAAKTLSELGAVIIDADKTAHRLMEPHQAVWEDIVNNFGLEILNSDMTINRIKLGAIVFDQPKQLEVLNRITGPRIVEALKNSIMKIKTERPESVVILDVPLLYEAHMEKLCDQVWVVWVSREIQIKRLMERNGFTQDEAIKRIESQISLDEKARQADVVIDNSGSLEETIRFVTIYFLDILHDS
jgi:dephospho-CoA kinase